MRHTHAALTPEQDSSTERPAAVGEVDDGVTWVVGDAEVASIDAATGVVTAVAPGQTTITATSTHDADQLDTTTLTVEARTATYVIAVKAVNGTGAGSTAPAHVFGPPLVLDPVDLAEVTP